MKLGFTGTRRGMTTAQWHRFKLFLENLYVVDCTPVQEFLHGGAVGADMQAADYAGELGIKCHCYPAIGTLYRATGTELIEPVAPPLVRNKQIVDACDLLIAAPAEPFEVLRSGTWSTIRYARKTSRNHVLIEPSGAFHRTEFR